jgi:hypothetical protein
VEDFRSGSEGVSELKITDDHQNSLKEVSAGMGQWLERGLKRFDFCWHHFDESVWKTSAFL